MDEGAPPDFSPRELFDYACGRLEHARADQLRRQLRVDADLAAKIAFFRMFVPSDVFFAQPSLAYFSRIALVAGAWGIAAGIADNYFSHLTPKATLKPVVLGVLTAGLVAAIVVLRRRLPRRSMQGTLYEAIELTTLLGLPLGWIVAAVAHYCKLPWAAPWAYLAIGACTLWLGSTRGIGLRAMARQTSRDVRLPDRVLRGVLYAAFLGQAYAIFGFLVILGASMSEIAGVVPSTLLVQLRIVGIVAAAAGAISAGVRGAVDDRLMLKEDRSVIWRTFIIEGAASAIVGPLLLATFIVVFGNFQILFVFIAVGAMVWWILNRLAEVAIHGDDGREVSIVKTFVVIACRRSIKLVLALALGAAWRILLVEPFGVDSLFALVGMLLYGYALIRIDRMHIPVERVLFPMMLEMKRNQAVLRHAAQLEFQLIRWHLDSIVTGLKQALVPNLELAVPAVRV